MCAADLSYAHEISERRLVYHELLPCLLIWVKIAFHSFRKQYQFACETLNYRMASFFIEMSGYCLQPVQWSSIQNLSKSICFTFGRTICSINRSAFEQWRNPHCQTKWTGFCFSHCFFCPNVLRILRHFGLFVPGFLTQPYANHESETWNASTCSSFIEVVEQYSERN